MKFISAITALLISTSSATNINNLAQVKAGVSFTHDPVTGDPISADFSGDLFFIHGLLGNKVTDWAEAGKSDLYEFLGTVDQAGIDATNQAALDLSNMISHFNMMKD